MAKLDEADRVAAAAEAAAERALVLTGSWELAAEALLHAIACVALGHRIDRTRLLDNLGRCYDAQQRADSGVAVVRMDDREARELWHELSGKRPAKDAVVAGFRKLRG